MESDVFKIRSRIAKSQYWQYFGDHLRADVHKESVEIYGRSGFYVPERASPLKRVGRKIRRAIRQPIAAVNRVREAITSRISLPRMMSYSTAFDAVMTGAEVSVPILSPYLINHRELVGVAGVLPTTASVKRHYRGWSSYEASANIITHYYYQNILRRFTAEEKIGTVLEIGAGNGNFASIFYHDWSPIRVIIVDLPETLAVAIPFLSSMFPGAEIVMPNEIEARGVPGSFDFAFVTVDQLALLPDDCVDLAVNCHSFQEMTRAQIAVYLELVQRVCRHSGIFFTANRVEKIPCGADAFMSMQSEPPNRMNDYPWNPGNEILVAEISKLSRLVQLDAVSLRLERVKKA